MYFHWSLQSTITKLTRECVTAAQAIQWKQRAASRSMLWHSNAALATAQTRVIMRMVGSRPLPYWTVDLMGSDEPCYAFTNRSRLLERRIKGLSSDID